MSDLKQLNKLRELLAELADKHGLTLEMFTVDPLDRTAKTMFKVRPEALKTLEEKETEDFNNKFAEMMKDFKL